MDEVSEPVPYEWCDSCDLPVDAETHLAWHAAGGTPLPGSAPAALQVGYSREEARRVVRP